MSDKRFLQDGFEKRLSHVIEECGELIAAAGKTQRWGRLSVNPLAPPAEQETNIDWLRREMADVREALDRLDQAIAEEVDTF
jgi:NTP pyrophosphatase (non-canonical NTP hydrolase)